LRNNEEAEMRSLLIIGLVLGLPLSAMAVPQFPPVASDGGWSIVLPDGFFDDLPPATPGIPGGVGPTPPSPVTPAGQGQHPLGGVPNKTGVRVSNVPEPGTAALLIAGLAGLVRSGRRRER
jgi:hypothetical protein